MAGEAAITDDGDARGAGCLASPEFQRVSASTSPRVRGQVPDPVLGDQSTAGRSTLWSDGTSAQTPDGGARCRADLRNHRPCQCAARRPLACRTGQPDAYGDTHADVARSLSACEPMEIVFTGGCTAAIDLVGV